MNFQVGQKVVFILNEKLGPGYSHEVTPKYGEIYTVREVIAVCSTVCIMLVEIVNRPSRYRLPDNSVDCVEIAFKAEYFRPLVERKTDISIFTAMLTPSPERVS